MIRPPLIPDWRRAALAACLCALPFSTARAQRPGAAAPRPAPDAVAQFIASLEQQYSAAIELYKSGQLDESRRAFDATLDRLLSSSYSIRDDARLQAEYDSLVDRIHALESDLILSGGLSNAQPQATPLERIPELTFPLDPATRAAIERESQPALSPGSAASLPLVLNDAVMRYIHYFTTSGKQDLIANFRRAGRYQAMMDQIFQAVGVPKDLLYLAQLESSFDPRLVSRAGARGIWQFMASRSDDYGLKRTHWVDERQDPQKSTEAAARHLKDLYAEFGDWDLAMAAYNSGPRTIQEIVARTGYADYWKLYDLDALPKYLRNYVPVILATAIIARNPQQYGILEITPDPPPAVDVANLSSPLDLRLAAECARVTVGDLQHLNPSLLHLEAPAGFALKLPGGSLDRFQLALARIPAPDRLQWRLHWAQAGDTWPSLARRYHVSLASLRRANAAAGGATPDRPRPGAPVALPLGLAPPPASRRAPARRAPAAHKSAGKNVALRLPLRLRDGTGLARM